MELDTLWSLLKHSIMEQLQLKSTINDRDKQIKALNNKLKELQDGVVDND